MKVLIVEDEILERKALIHLMKTEFEQVSIVLTADNGEQAVKMAVQERPDLILMDGGRGQVNIARKVLGELGIDIPVCGMVKDDNHRTRGVWE